MKATTSYILENFICDGFLEKHLTSYILNENSEDGKSQLTWECKNEINICIPDFDKKNTRFLFLKDDVTLHLNKRVDHVILELNPYEKWDAHLIEMKTGVEYREKWVEIKGKFRASYLAVKAISSMLDIEIEKFYFYTTYEHASFMQQKENTITRKAHLGKKAIKPEDEWTGVDFGLNIGERLSFSHTPIKMMRDVDGTLVRKMC